MTKRAHYLKEWREIRGLSLREVENIIGSEVLSYSSISRIESGIQPYTEQTLTEFSKAYGVPPWALLSINPLGMK